MMLQIGDDGVVSKVDEEELIYVDKNELNELIDKYNHLKEENGELKQELKIYREVASCSNCKYQNYDWFDDGDEFEVCDKGNNEQQIDYHICKDWREL